MENFKENQGKFILYAMIGCSALILFLLFVFDVTQVDFMGYTVSASIYDIDNPALCLIGLLFMISCPIFLVCKQIVLNEKFAGNEKMLTYCSIITMAISVIGIILFLMNICESYSEMGISISSTPTFISYIAIILCVVQIAALAYLTFFVKEK